MVKIKYYLLFSIFGATLVLWQLFLPGYILTLDMVFGPIVIFPTLAEMTTSNYLIVILQYLASLVVEGWVVQKILLFSLFVAMFYTPIRYYLFSSLEHTCSRYFVGVFYVVNPFVYERLLAGQWLVLAGYALLPGFVYALRELFYEQSWRNLRHTFIWLLLIGLVSLHFLVMSVVMLALFMMVMMTVFLWLHEWDKVKTFSFRFLLGGSLFLVVSSYWLIPLYLNQGNSILNIINQQHIQAFRTASDDTVGLSANVALMYGFWLEREPWIEDFVVPKDVRGLTWWISLFVLMGLVGLGLYRGLKDRTQRFTSWLLVLFGIMAFVFSSGVGDGSSRAFNQWLFDTIPFWSGFRDSQKWSGFLMLTYSMAAGLGLQYLLGLLKRRIVSPLVFLVACALPILYTPTLLFGLAGQLQVVSYPTEWAEVNAMLQVDKDCKAVFLPWQQYYSLRFNNSRLTSNTAQSFFDCEIISGHNMELGTVSSQGGNSSEYEMIEAVMMNNDINAEVGNDTLRQIGIDYLIVTDDIVFDDPYFYSVLKSKRAIKIMDLKGIDLYTI